VPKLATRGEHVCRDYFCIGAEGDYSRLCRSPLRGQRRAAALFFGRLRGLVEPPKGLTPCRFSRPVHSTALPPLQMFDFPARGGHSQCGGALLRPSMGSALRAVGALRQRSESLPATPSTALPPRLNSRNSANNPYLRQFRGAKEYLIESYRESGHGLPVEFLNFAPIIQPRTFTIR